MTEKEALEILKKHGIHRGYYESDRLFLRTEGEPFGEQVGAFDTKMIWISAYLPSAIGSTYSQVPMTPVALDAPRARIVLETLLQDLSTSAQRYEEDQRKERVQNMKKYFEDRRIEKKWSVFL